MRFRAASLFCVLAFATLPTQAQGPRGGKPATGNPIQALTDQLAALTARVAKLEGQITSSDLAGTYAIHGIQNEMLSNADGVPTQVSSYVYVGTAVLAVDGTTALSVTQSGNGLFITTPSSRFPVNSGGSLTGNWTYADGVVTTTGSGAPIPLTVAAGGRVLIGASANHSDGTNVLLIFTRLQ